MNLENKVILIIGATGGIGKALAVKLFEEKTKLILVSKSKTLLTKLSSKLGKAQHYQVDLSNQVDVVKLIQQIKKDYKTIDIVINAAGIGVYKPLKDISLEEWNKSQAVNVNAPFIVIKELLSLVKLSDVSLFLTIGSGTSVIPMKNRSAYCSNKFALRGLSLSLSDEYEDQKPKFCLITLGSTLTSFGPLSLEEKEKQHKEGRAYFTPKWVANKLTEIIKNKNRKEEYVLYPSELVGGTWEKSK